MEVTRREMLTAASAVGVTAALAQGQVKAAVPVATVASALFGAGGWARTDVDPTHFGKAARAIRRASPIAFGGFTQADLKSWALDGNNTPIPGHRVRGFYKDNNPGVNTNLRLVYAFSYTPGTPNANYQFFVVGAASRSQCIRQSAVIATNEIIYDLQHEGSFYSGSQTNLTFANVPSFLMRGKSFLSLMLKYLARNQSSMPGVSFTKNSPPSSWTLTVEKI